MKNDLINSYDFAQKANVLCWIYLRICIKGDIFKTKDNEKNIKNLFWYPYIRVKRGFWLTFSSWSLSFIGALQWLNQQ